MVRMSPTEFKNASPNEDITQRRNVTVHISEVNRIVYKDNNITCKIQNPHAHADC